MKKNPVVHFEMAYDDKDRMVDFYAKSFGWEANKLGPEMGNYVVVTTTETDEQRMVKTPGTINGGFFKRTENGMSQAPRLVIAVDDIREAMKRVVDAGGKVLGGLQKPGEPDEIPGVGLYAAAIDTEGNRVGMLQPKM